MQEQNRNLLLAFGLSLLVLVVWMWMFPPPEPTPRDTADVAELPVAGGGEAQSMAEAEQVSADEELPRIAIQTPRLAGTINLRGGRIDDLVLLDYRETTEPGSDNVHLLNPEGSRNAFYALYGWRPGPNMDWDMVPGANTPWEVIEGTTLGVGSPVTLGWTNANGLQFTQRFVIDDNFMLTVAQGVVNTGTETARMAPYGLISRHGEPDDLENFFISHEGFIQVADGKLSEDKYKAIRDFRVHERENTNARVTEVAANGWLAIADKYWMAAIVSDAGPEFLGGAALYPCARRLSGPR